MSLPFLTLPSPFAPRPVSHTPAVPVGVPVVSSYGAYRPPSPAAAALATPAPPAPAPRKSIKKSTSSSSAAPQKKVRSSKSNIPGASRYWTPSEHRLFVIALLKYGPKDLKAIAAHVGTRNMIQCRTHEQKCFMRLMREAQRETELRAAAAAAQKRAARAEADGSADTDCGSDSTSAASEEEAAVAAEVARASQGKAKEVYSVPSSCGITLLSVVGDELSRALSAS